MKRAMSTMPKRKQNVFVPEYPGKPVYEGYHGIPANEYIQRTAMALEEFIQQRKCTFSIRTLNGTRKFIYNPIVNISGDQIVVNAEGSTISINPTKYGLDTVDSYSFNMFGGPKGEKDRFWLFDGDTLSELDIVREMRHQ